MTSLLITAVAWGSTIVKWGPAIYYAGEVAFKFILPYGVKAEPSLFKAEKCSSTLAKDVFSEIFEKEKNCAKIY